MSVPYIGFANETLEKLPRAKPGDTVWIEDCGHEHRLVGPDQGGDALLVYNCEGKTYLAGVAGRLTIGVKADVSSRAPSGQEGDPE